ncbi:ribonuclease H protein, partial [Tanacetum coccineum]
QNPGDLHWTTVKNILKYLRNTKDMFLVYGVSGYVFILNGGTVDWKNVKQSIFATSYGEAEYIAAYDAYKEAVWVRKFISRLGVVLTIEEPINMYCDNTGAITIANESGITKDLNESDALLCFAADICTSSNSHFPSSTTKACSSGVCGEDGVMLKMGMKKMSRMRKGKGAIAFWAGPNLVVWARYAFRARGHVATIAVGTTAFYLADARINKWHWRIMNWVLHKEITVKDADINNNGFLRLNVKEHNTLWESAWMYSALRLSFERKLLDVGDGNAGNSSWVAYCIADTETAKSDLINFIYDDETLQRPTAKAFQAKPIACPKYETADMINSQVLAMFSSESYTYRSHDEAIPHGNDDGNVFSQLITVKATSNKGRSKFLDKSLADAHDSFDALFCRPCKIHLMLSLWCMLLHTSKIRNEVVALKNSFNEVKYENERLQASLQLINENYKEMKEEKTSSLQRTLCGFKWMSPEPNYLKQNTDGCFKRDPNHTSYGGLIRNSEGTWLCGYMGKLDGEWYGSREAKIWGIYKGLCLIRDMILSNVKIETDYLDVINAIQDGIDPLRFEKEAIKTIMRQQKCFLVHTKRDGNQCADVLAKLGKTQSKEYIVLENPPELLLPYLSEDTQSALVFKRYGQFPF